MAKYIERKAVANAFQELLSSPHANIHNGPFNAGVRDALKLARDMVLDNVPNGLKIPPADVVPVVRCRECRYYKPVPTPSGERMACIKNADEEDGTYYGHKEYRDGDWFCADGIRKGSVDHR